MFVIQAFGRALLLAHCHTICHNWQYFLSNPYVLPFYFANYINAGFNEANVQVDITNIYDLHCRFKQHEKFVFDVYSHNCIEQ